MVLALSEGGLPVAPPLDPPPELELEEVIPARTRELGEAVLR
jgi:hypothetical protein